MRWYWKDTGGHWKLQDSIPIHITGGREEGFRGYGAKNNFQAGDWKLQVETLDDREIGRVYFDVASASVNDDKYLRMIDSLSRRANARRAAPNAPHRSMVRVLVRCREGDWSQCET